MEEEPSISKLDTLPEPALETKTFTRPSLHLNLKLQSSISTNQFFTESQHFEPKNKPPLPVSGFQIEALENARISLKNLDQRRKTIQIFQHTEINRKNFEHFDLEEVNRQPVVTTILRNNDSPVLLKELIKRSNKAFMDKKPQPGKGLMFINELWNVKYEKKTKKSCKLDGATSKEAEKAKTKSLERERTRRTLVLAASSKKSAAADLKMYPQSVSSNAMDAAEHHDPGTLIDHSFDSEEQNTQQSPVISHNCSQVKIKEELLPKIPSPNFSKRQTMCTLQYSNTYSPSTSARSLNSSPLRKPPRALGSLKIHQEQEQSSSSPSPPNSKREFRLRSLRSNFCPSSESPSPTSTTRQGSFARNNSQSQSQVFSFSPLRKPNPPNLVNLPITARESFRTKDFTEQKGQNINELLNMCKVELGEKNSKNLYTNVLDQYSTKLPLRKGSLQHVRKNRVITQCQHSIKLGRNQGQGKLLQLK